MNKYLSLIIVSGFLSTGAVHSLSQERLDQIKKEFDSLKTTKCSTLEELKQSIAKCNKLNFELLLELTRQDAYGKEENYNEILDLKRETQKFAEKNSVMLNDLINEFIAINPLTVAPRDLLSVGSRVCEALNMQSSLSKQAQESLFLWLNLEKNMCQLLTLKLDRSHEEDPAVRSALLGHRALRKKLLALGKKFGLKLTQRIDPEPYGLQDKEPKKPKLKSGYKAPIEIYRQQMPLSQLEIQTLRLQ